MCRQAGQKAARLRKSSQVMSESSLELPPKYHSTPAPPAIGFPQSAFLRALTRLEAAPVWESSRRPTLESPGSSQATTQGLPSSDELVTQRFVSLNSVAK